MGIRVVMTGGAGFLGSHPCERPTAGGREVVCPDHRSTGATAGLAHLLDPGPFTPIRTDGTNAELGWTPPVSRGEGPPRAAGGFRELLPRDRRR